MNYAMNVVISNPDSGNVVQMDLTAEFCKNENTYGNGFYMGIENESGSFSVSYDIRYDRSFNPSDKVSYLTQWANNFWNGKEGAYKVDKLTVVQLD